MITPDAGPGFVVDLPVNKFHGVGPATTAKMNGLGIYDGRDLRAQTLEFLRQHFGKSGPYYYSIARGIDDRPVRADRIRKSVGAENTFAADLTAVDAMCSALQPIIDKVWRYCEQSGVRGRTVTLKVKYADFELITRSRSMPDWVGSREEVERVAVDLLRRLCPVPKGVRLLGVSLSALATGEREDNSQMHLAL